MAETTELEKRVRELHEMEFRPEYPAAMLFPQYAETLKYMIFVEVKGLTDQQLDWESDRWEWSKWSIRRQLSHIASLHFRWVLIRCGDQLFPEGRPEVEDLESIVNSPYDRRMDENKYWDMNVILQKVQEGLELAELGLSWETVASIRSKQIVYENVPSYWEQLIKAHPIGVWRDPQNPNTLHMTLDAAFRHMYFETITHLYNIQRLKRAQGLRTKVNLPDDGYWRLPDWDRSEPPRPR